MSCLQVYDNATSIDETFISNTFHSEDMANIIHKLDIGFPFAYIRYGDLEWRMILENNGNIEHDNIPELTDKLKEVLEMSYFRFDNNFYFSFSDKLFRTEHVYAGAKNFIEQNNVTYNFVTSDLFSDMLRYNNTQYLEFLDVFKTKNIVLISNEHFTNLNPTNMFVPFAHIVIPKKNCFAFYDTIRAEIVSIINDNPTLDIVFAFCSSAMAPVMIEDLFREYNGMRYTFIDFGSFFDFFLGFASRTPSICFKQTLFDNYTLCMSTNITSADDVQEISGSLA